MELLVIGFWVLCGVGAAMIADSKGRNGCGWFIAGTLFGPLTLLVVGFMAPVTQLSTTQRAHHLNSDDRKKCPYCAESILAEAKVCRYCGRDLPSVSRQGTPNTIAPIAAYKTCLNCKEGNPKSAALCVHCGARLTTGGTQGAKPLSCPTCGERNSPGSLYCFNCQASLQQALAVTIPEALTRPWLDDGLG